MDETGRCITEEIIEGTREEPGVQGSGHGEARELPRSRWELQGGRLPFHERETMSPGCCPLRRSGKEGCQKDWTPAGEIPAGNALKGIRQDPVFSSGLDQGRGSSMQVLYE